VGSAAQYFEVEAPVEQVYAYWRDFSHFPAFMPDVEQVIVTGPTTSHWKVTGPLGKSVEWDAEIVEDVPNQRIAWHSVGDADVDNAGAVRFDDRGGRTNIEVSLTYDPPGGKAGELVAELVKDPTSRSSGRSRTSAWWWRAAASTLSDRCQSAAPGLGPGSQPRRSWQTSWPTSSSDDLLRRGAEVASAERPIVAMLISVFRVT
jgi:carbon monoxide dehydrogenase subunit G